MSTIKVPAAAALQLAMAESEFWKNHALANAAWLHEAREENRKLKEELDRFLEKQTCPQAKVQTKEITDGK